MIYNVMFPLVKYLFRFQNFVDNFRGHPSRPTDLECTETLLAGINSRRCTYIWHKYCGTTATKPTNANLKAELFQSDKNQVSSNDDMAVSNVVTVSSVSEPPPIALVLSSPNLLFFSRFSEQCVANSSPLNPLGAQTMSPAELSVKKLSP